MALSLRGALIWAGLAAVLIIPMAVAAGSPLLQWRGPVYILSSFAGIAALGLVLVQPLLAGGYLPGLSTRPGRRAHRWVGAALVMMVVAHVGLLWLTSAPDVIDALLFDSPTPFSIWGVIAMWATFAAALLAALRGRIRIAPKTWRIAHKAFVIVIVACGVVHALLVEGAMGTVSKAMLCALVVAATLWVLLGRK
ncbi:MAG: ferric reductase-like transmembrane domain-containing protein [Beijerinckiaceae bacterium]